MAMISTKLKFKLFCIFFLFIICGLFLTLNCFYISGYKLGKVEKFFPKVNLGLDLVGGLHLVFKPDIDSYLSEKYAKISSEILKFQNIKVKNISKEGIEIIVKDSPEAIIDVKKIDPDLMVKNDFIYYENERIKAFISDLIQQSIQVIRNRVDALGTKEVNMYKSGSENIVLQIPGDSKMSDIKSILGTTAKMNFHLVDSINPFSYVKNDNKSGVMMQLELKDVKNGKIYYNLEKTPIVFGEDLSDARVSFDSFTPSVSITFNSKGSADFAKATAYNVNRQLAIVIDNKVISAPNINEPILGGRAVISGHFSQEEAKNLAISLKSGALPAKLLIIEEKTIGASLGENSIKSAGIAIFFGLIFVLIFMVLYYKLMGIVAIFGLMMNLFLTVTIFAIFGITLTLPGMAGLLLTLGMAVDANVLIYEKMKEFDRKKATKMFLIERGFSGAMEAIVDSNLTTILSASTLIFFGTAFVKGFAVSLTIGILCSFVTAVSISRVFAEFIAKRGDSRVGNLFV